MPAVRRLLSLIAVVAVLAAPAAALGKTQRAHADAVSAAFAYRGSFPNYTHERLTISRAGAVVYHQPVSSAYCDTSCAPGAPVGRFSSLHVVDLDANGEPEVMLDLYTGGAHCCTVEQVFAFDAGAGRYVKTEHNFGDPGQKLEDLGHDGRLEFVTADDSFAYTFTDYAASGLPLQILSFSGGRFVNVTRSYPDLIQADAKHWLRRFTHSRRDNVGLIAAWAADQYLLGHRGLVKRKLARAARRGELRSVVSPLPSGKKFVRTLYRFLHKHGYTR